MNDSSVLYKPFDIKIHADNFVNYLEVIIKEDGTIEYAIPSHSKKLEEIAQIKYGKDKFIEMIRDPDAFYDYMKWLCNKTKCVSVWNEYIIKPDNISKKQIDTLKLLSKTVYTHIPTMALYRGDLE